MEMLPGREPHTVSFCALEFLVMSKRRPLALAHLPVMLAALAACAAVSLGAERARLATYENGAGEKFFALSLSTSAMPAADAPRQVAVLMDTSASQSGIFREDALVALDSLLASLNRDDRVQLIAVDLKAAVLTKSPAAPGSAELKAARAKLAKRAP